MKIDHEQLVYDLSPFADLGSDPIHSVRTGDGVALRLTRLGEQITLKFEMSGVREIVGSEERFFSSLKALLASPRFGNLGQWADSQKLLLRERVESETLPMTGSSPQGDGGIDVAEAILRSGADGKLRNVVLIIDGPAGIGKTSFVRRISYNRAQSYRQRQDPLVLHVESRGRVLQNIMDLMAFSLQTLRVSITYDQIPTLVKNGLVTLAIDGFDELGDPNGYDLAWAQLNELIESGRGSGKFILSGRETFISSARIAKALPAIDTNYDTLTSYTIAAVTPNAARTWLESKGWSPEVLRSEAALPLFEKGSYALRPFFLSQLSYISSRDKVRYEDLNGILTFLIDSMTSRESTKFGRDVEAVTSVNQRENFIKSLMEEVARDLADNQTDSISGDTLVWLADMVSGDIPAEVKGILRNRVQVIAFLTNDLRRGYRRFIHEQIQNYYLSHVVLKVVIRGELPKFLRRNIFGLDFLENFAEVVRSESQDNVNAFVKSGLDIINNVSDQDRARRNIASLIMVCCSLFMVVPGVVLKDVAIDEALLIETPVNLKFMRCTIAQLDARSANLIFIEFSESYLITLLADSGTIPSQSIPTPSVLETPDGMFNAEAEVEEWLGRRFFDAANINPRANFAFSMNHFPILRLLSRFVRYKPFWLKDTEENSARKILDDKNWPILKSVLEKHELLVERTDVPAAGKPGIYYHLKNKEALREYKNPPDWVLALVNDMLKAAPD